MTPEELKLLVKVPVSTLENVSGLQDGKLLFYDTSTPENKLKLISTAFFSDKSSVDNIEDLRNIDLSEGDIVTLLGYNVSGDKDPLNYKYTLLDYNTLVDDGGSVIKTAQGSWIAQFSEIIDGRDFGFFPVDFEPTLLNFTTQQTLFEQIRNFCIDNLKDLILAPGNYCINVFRTGYAVDKMKINIKCNGIAKVYLRQTTTIPISSATMVQIWDDAYLENIHFYSLEPDLNSQRATTEGRKNIYIKKCGFFNFKNPTNGNGWGLYLKTTENITLDNCIYGGNTQSDIAIVDDVNNLTIINPINTLDSGVYLNVEPNSIAIDRNIQLRGGHYRRLNILTNVITENPIQAMSIIGCEIDWLMYDGGDIDVIASQVKLMTNQEFINIPLGNLDISLRFGANLLKDPYLVDYDYADTTTRNWRYSTGSPLQTNRVNKDYTTIGDRTATATTVLKSDFIPIDVNKKYLFMVNGRANYFGSAINNISRFCRVRLYDDTFTPIVITKPVSGVPTNYDYITINGFRFPLSTTGSTSFINQIGILEFLQYAPTAKYIVIELGKHSSNTNEFDFKYISLNEINSYEKGENISSYISRNLPIGKYAITGIPPNNATANRTSGFKTGDILQNDTGSTYVVTDGSIRPAVTKNISANATTSIKGLVNQSATQANSTATDVPTLVTDFNALLAKLKTAGIVA